MDYSLIDLEQLDQSMLLFELATLTARMDDDGARKITSALHLANHLHRNQSRVIDKGAPGTPYIEHPVRVAVRLGRWGCRDADLITIALLHDVVEDGARELVEMFGRDTMFDTRRTLHSEAISMLANTYGHRVAEGVAMLTNGFRHPELGYVDHIEKLCTNDDFALVKASDLCDNAGSLSSQVTTMTFSLLRHRLRKYTPAIDVLVDSFLARPMSNDVINNASRSMNRLAFDLEQLNKQITEAFNRYHDKIINHS